MFEKCSPKSCYTCKGKRWYNIIAIKQSISLRESRGCRRQMEVRPCLQSAGLLFGSELESFQQGHESNQGQTEQKVDIWGKIISGMLGKMEYSCLTVFVGVFSPLLWVYCLCFREELHSNAWMGKDGKTRHAKARGLNPLSVDRKRGGKKGQIRNFPLRNNTEWLTNSGSLCRTPSPCIWGFFLPCILTGWLSLSCSL